MPFLLTCLVLIAVAVVPGAVPAAAVAEELRYVAADDFRIRIGLPCIDAEVMLVGVRPAVSQMGGEELHFQGRAAGQEVAIGRWGNDGHDRLFDRFELHDLQGKRLGGGRYATDLRELSAPGISKPWPRSIKGVQDVVDFDDAVQLGVVHTTINVAITDMLQGAPETSDHADPWQITVDGITYGMNAAAVQRLDSQVIAATERGINVIAIILCLSRQPRGVAAELLHPDADLVNSPTGVIAANTKTVEGERRYRAALAFLARRYSRPDQRYGHIGGYIIGNEVQSHWYWHNQGRRPAGEVIRQYARQVRLSYYALRTECQDPQVFISMDHHWTKQHGNDDTKAMTGRFFLDQFARLVHEEGDFPWHVAFHPYPENLFDPAFWEDRTATYAYDTPRITFKNIEVLVDYLRRPRLCYDGSPRRLILSEQGFHSDNTPEGDILQAAAYAASFVRISAIEEIDAYILHRYVDHPAEGGLNLGLRKRSADGHVGDKRPMYDVFRAAGTERQQGVFQFALPIVGIEHWSEVLPRRGPFPEQGP
ncbi:MAG: hypothetical protein KatS3mg111_2560 [Pirellulaceae bacterium]|nr:MAG: hypothetical protein KatS3mg111_2560 [Pirellulaceae bacterium]